MVDLSIIIPAYNEEKRIEKTLEDYVRFFSKKKIDFEIFIVLNGCRDNTLGVVQKIEKKYRWIKHIDIKEAIGKDGAVIEGFKRTEGNFIGFVDADNASPPQEFYKLLENIKEYDGAIGSRWMKNSKVKMSLLRKILSKCFHAYVNLLFNLKYQDTQCGCKLFKNPAIKKVVNHLGATKWAWDVDLLYLMKRESYKIKEVPTVWAEPGKSHVKLSQIISGFVLPLIRLRLYYSPFKPIIGVYNKTLLKLTK